MSSYNNSRITRGHGECIKLAKRIKCLTIKLENCKTVSTAINDSDEIPKKKSTSNYNFPSGDTKALYQLHLEHKCLVNEIKKYEKNELISNVVNNYEITIHEETMRNFNPKKAMQNIIITGWCPKKRRSEDGSIDKKYPLKETNTNEYNQRTEMNVKDTEATLILLLNNYKDR
ncbi:27355_t:CDS:2, partial [Gigaspora margarita]